MKKAMKRKSSWNEFFEQRAPAAEKEQRNRPTNMVSELCIETAPPPLRQRQGSRLHRAHPLQCQGITTVRGAVPVEVRAAKRG